MIDHQVSDACHSEGNNRVHLIVLHIQEGYGVTLDQHLDSANSVGALPEERSAVTIRSSRFKVSRNNFLED
jgi:hypothetical protein